MICLLSTVPQTPIKTPILIEKQKLRTNTHRLRAQHLTEHCGVKMIQHVFFNLKIPQKML